MPYANSPAEHYAIQAQGPCAVVYPALSQPGTVGAGATWTSAVVLANGYIKLACGVTLAQAGSLSIQRYVDALGTVPLGAPVSVTLVAGTANAVTVADGLPFGSFTVSVTNSSGSVGALSNFALLMSAN